MKKIKKHSKHNFRGLFLDGYSYDNWLHKWNDKGLIDSLESGEKVLVIPPLEGDEKVEVKGNKILTSNKYFKYC